MDATRQALGGQRPCSELAGHYPGKQQCRIDRVVAYMQACERGTVICNFQSVDLFNRAICLDDNYPRWGQAYHFG